MKYTRLTKEQLEALHHEFARFLATQQINAEEWNQIKQNKPHIAEEEIDIFSDLVWERSLQNISFLEKIEKNAIYLFDFQADTAKMMQISTQKTDIDFTTEKGFLWLTQNIKSAEIEFAQGSKTVGENRNIEMFKLLSEGCQVADNQLVTFFKSVFY